MAADRAETILLEIEITALVMGGEKIRLIEGVIGERLSQVGKVEEDAGIIRDKEFGFQQELLDMLSLAQRGAEQLRYLQQKAIEEAAP